MFFEGAYLKLLSDVLIGKTLEATRSEESWVKALDLWKAAGYVFVCVCMYRDPRVSSWREKTNLFKKQKTTTKLSISQFHEFLLSNNWVSSEVCRQKRRVVWVSFRAAAKLLYASCWNFVAVVAIKVLLAPQPLHKDWVSNRRTSPYYSSWLRRAHWANVAAVHHRQIVSHCLVSM